MTPVQLPNDLMVCLARAGAAQTIEKETTLMAEPIQNRYDLAYFFDITDGNPNGDPDAGNLPRIDPETGQGLVTDVCLKRKIRNYVGLVKEETPNYDIYVREKAVLTAQQRRAFTALKIDPKKRATKAEEKLEEERRLTQWMCQNFFDIRAFGAVMTTGQTGGVNAGQVRGPVQFGFARSLHPVVSQEFALTVCAARMEDKPVEAQIGIQGRKFAVPYGLYRVHGYVNACLAGGDKGTGFSEDDLALLKQALNLMFEQDKSAARANMRPVACVAFKHDSKLGNARSDQLFDLVKVTPKQGVQPLPGDVAAGTNPEGRPPRRFEDYDLTVDDSQVPEGVTVERWI